VAVCVYCASSTTVPARYPALAASVGTGLGRRGWACVSGGGSVSAMGALARAARAAGAHTVGVIPAALAAAEVADTDADELVVVADMRTRKAVMDARADAFLALPGGLGTLEELFEVWVAASLGMHTKPVVVCDPDGVFDSVRTLVDDLVGAGFVRPAAASVVVWTTDVEEALDAIEQRLAAAPTPGAVAAGSAEEALEAD